MSHVTLMPAKSIICLTPYTPDVSKCQDGDMAYTSQWSGAPEVGDECNITYNLRAVREMSDIRLGKLSFNTFLIRFEQSRR